MAAKMSCFCAAIRGGQRCTRVRKLYMKDGLAARACRPGGKGKAAKTSLAFADDAGEATEDELAEGTVEIIDADKADDEESQRRASLKAQSAKARWSKVKKKMNKSTSFNRCIHKIVKHNKKKYDFLRILNKLHYSLGSGNKENIDEIELRIQKLEDTLGPFTDWSLPGGSETGALADWARVVCRRSERAVCSLNSAEPLQNKSILIYLNRLSDWLWLEARLLDAAGEG